MTVQLMMFDFTLIGLLSQDLRESAAWITTKRKEAREAGNMYQVGKQPVDLKALNPKQRLAYSVVQLHHHNFNNILPSEPLRMIITGTACTGKLSMHWLNVWENSIF